ncbi:MAG: tetratricopeptide repeat protein, partial [Candidatus Dormibacteraceae bacterium]
HQGQLESAQGHLLTALSGSVALEIDRRGRGFILNNLGLLNLRRGEMDVARDYLAQALQCGQATGESLVLAEAHELLGKVAEHESDPRAADQEFATAIGLLETVGMPDRLRDLHMEYATLLDARPDIEASVRHWRQAAQLGKLDAAGLKWSGSEQEAGISASG